jgi:dipeptidyl aminopeptidase/acylaminoacyl peptidase
MTRATRPAIWMAALLFAVTAPVAAFAQDTLSPHHVARLKSVAQIALSPSGNEVAYVLVVPRIPLQDDDGPSWTELHVVGTDGRSRPYVTGAVNVAAIQWTPDGRGIAFLARRPGDATRALYVISREGGEARKVLSHSTDLVNYAFSPDGTRIGFVARDPVPASRTELARRGFTQEIFEEQIPAQRVWIAPWGDGGAGTATVINAPGHATTIIWNPAGTRLAVLYAPTPLVDDDLMGKRVHIVDPALAEPVVRIDNPGKIGQIGWSPDGRQLAMISAADLNDPSEGRLMVASATGGAPLDLMPAYEAHVRAFSWIDDESLVFMSDEGVSSVLGSVRRDGGNGQTFVSGGPVMTALDRAANGTTAFIGHTPTHPAEVFVHRPGAAAPTRLTDSNPWLSAIRLATQEVVSFKARDGLALEGILIRPLDERPGQRYPLILNVHGGPESRDTNGWVTSYSNAGQTAAAQGFAVFYPNYRGSTGKGVAFSKLGQGDPAGREFDDLIDAVDHLVAMGLVDRDKVGITGGSYGGYASAWGATYYTERFAAAVMFVGISNKVSKVGTTDIANEEFHVHARKRPWDDWAFMLDRSPVTHAAKSRTPILILHGTADPRVHPTQSLELYRHLTLHGKTVRLVWYPGEGHGNARAASRLDYNLRLLQWMTHYLKGPGGAPPPADLDYRSGGR